MTILESIIIVSLSVGLIAGVASAIESRRNLRRRKCVDCGYERRYGETPHEITGCPSGPDIQAQARRYIEKGGDRTKQTIGFVKHPTIDEIDHRTIGQ